MATSNNRLQQLLQRIQVARIAHDVRHDLRGAGSVEVAVPGERWEIDILNDGSVEIEVFKSDGTIFDASKLSELFKRFTD